jgi:hypothetical protein
MARPAPNCWTSPSAPRDQLAEQQGQEGPGSPASYRLGDQASIELASHAIAAGLARFRLRLSYDDEIGPHMLARIAKRTGLTPGDL